MSAEQRLPSTGPCDAVGCNGQYVLDVETVDDRLVEFPCTDEHCDWGQTVPRAAFLKRAEYNGVDVDALRATGVSA